MHDTTQDKGCQPEIQSEAEAGIFLHELFLTALALGFLPACEEIKMKLFLLFVSKEGDHFSKVLDESEVLYFSKYLFN